MPAQCRGRRDAQDVIEAIGHPPVRSFGTAIMAIAAQQDVHIGQSGADRSQQAPQESANLLAAEPLTGRSTAVMKRPSPSNATIG